MNIVSALLFAAGLLDMTDTRPAAGPVPPLTTVNHVDLRRYAGKWYEIARYPNRFQRDCQTNTTATYTLRKNGSVEVVNTCRAKNGKTKIARGTAKVCDKKTNARLRVTFFWPFYGNYWIIGLSPDYGYAIVGEPERKYLWILNRTPNMDEKTYRKVRQRITSLGYDPDKLLRTVHVAQEQ